MSSFNTACGICHSHHSIPYGKGSLLEISEILTLHSEEMNKIPPCYEAILRNKLRGIIDWMLTQPGWDNNSIYNLLCTYKKVSIDANKNTDGDDISEIMINCSVAGDRENFLSDEHKEAYLMYQEQLEDITDKALYSLEAKLHWYKAKLTVLNNELKLHDRIQDALDVIPSVGTWDTSYAKYIRTCWSRLDTLYREGKLSFGAWYSFVNQLREKVGMDLMKQPKYEIRDLADKITYYENRMEEIKQEIWENKNPIAGIKLESEELADLINEIEAADDINLA